MSRTINQIEPKAKEPPFPQIDLEFRMIGLDGSQTGRKEFRASHFRTLDVCNVPRRGQTTACPIPSEPVLELVSKPREPGKKKKGSTHVCHLLCHLLRGVVTQLLFARTDSTLTNAS